MLAVTGNNKLSGRRTAKAVALACLLSLLSACGASSLVVEGSYPTPAVRKIALSLGLYLDEDQVIVERVAEVSEKLGVPRAQVALAWVLSKPGVVAPIVGVTKEHHLTDAVEALKVKLSPEDIASLEEPYKPHPVVGFQ